ncbi:MAG: 7-cyano-7-deazaguanine synthase QueC [Candidatus Omnitrophota bacterium]
MRRISSGKKAVVLLSGGIDSVTTLYLAKQEKCTLNALIFDYGQRHKKEIRAAKHIALLNKICYYVVKISLPWVKSALTRRDIVVPRGRNLSSKDIPITYVSGRNIIFLSYAASFAESIGAEKIFIGAHVADYSGYPDCRPGFIDHMEKAICSGIAGKNIEIVTPFINKSKKEIVNTARKLSVPLQYTWSCYQGNKYPCCECDSCRYRIKAFEELGLLDPLLKKHRA